MDRNVTKVKITVEEFNRHGQRISRTVTLQTRDDTAEAPRPFGFTLPESQEND